MNEASDGTRRPGAKRRVVPIVILSALVLIACLITQMGALSAALSRSSSPSYAMLVGIDASSSDHATVSGLSGRDGSVRWRRQIDLAYTSGLVTDGVVYVAGLMHGKPTEEPTAIEALRLSDGATLWRLAFPVTPEAPSTILHMLADNGLLIMTIDTVTTVNIAAVNLSTHTLVWDENMPNFPPSWVDHLLATGSGLLYVSSSRDADIVRAYQLSDGRLIWTTRLYATTDPRLVAHDGALIAYDSQGSLVGLRPADGVILWKRQFSLSPTAGAQVSQAGAGISMCSAGSMNAPSTLVMIDPATGATLRNYQVSCTGPDPIVSGAHIYALEYHILTARRASDSSVVWHAEPEESDLQYSDLYSDGDVLFVNTQLWRYPFIPLCAHVWTASVGFCTSKTYLAALDGATGKSYWRSADGYDVFLGVAHP